MPKKEKFNQILEEMLDLAGVPLSEQEDDEEENKTDVEVEPEDQEDQEDQEDEELQDKWEVNISSRGTFKIEWTDSYVWVWYKNKRSDKIAIPAKLRPYRSVLSSFLNKLFIWLEETS